MLESIPNIGSDRIGISWNFFRIQSFVSSAAFLAAGFAEDPCGGGVTDDEGDVFRFLFKSYSECSSL